MSSQTVKKILEGGQAVGALGGIGIFLFILAIVFGNLSGNSGFAAGSQGANDTAAILANNTLGIRTYSGNLPLVYQALGITLLIFVFVGLASYAFSAFMKLTQGARGGYGD